MPAIPIKDTLDRIPGGMMVVPLLLGCAIANLAPNAPKFLGSFSGALFGAALPILAVFFVCIGATISFETTPYILKKGGVLLLTKIACGFVCAVIASRLIGNGTVSGGFFGGMSALAVVAAVNDTNGGLYMSLMGQYGRTRDAAAYSVMSLESGPFLTMLTLGAAGLSAFPWPALLGAILPLLVGMLLGNLDTKMREFLGRGVAVLIPFFAFALGTTIDAKGLWHAGLPGVVLGLFVVAFTGTFLFLVDRLTGGNGIAGLAAASTAGNAAAVPLIVATANPAYKQAAVSATVFVSASVVVTAIVVPILTAWAARRIELTEAKAALRIVANYLLNPHHDAGPPMNARDAHATTLPRIAITMGDPAGVGPEICLRMLSDPRVAAICVPIIFGDATVLSRVAREVGLQQELNILSPTEWTHNANKVTAPSVLNLSAIDGATIQPGQVDAATGRAGFVYIERAIKSALSGEIDAVATGPIHKEALRMAGIPFPGHTEIFAEMTHTKNACMMLTSPELSCSFVTVHVGYRDVPALLTVDRVLAVIDLTAAAMLRIRGRAPKLAICGLNPHAGEHGLFGDREEERIIVPAVAAARAKRIVIDGPLPPDTAFLPGRRRTTDAFVCMYHDQGHIPLKALAFDEAVNITLGLPIIRTSVDHGTALDIAWQGKANPNSMFEAIQIAARLATDKRPA